MRKSNNTTHLNFCSSTRPQSFILHADFSFLLLKLTQFLFFLAIMSNLSQFHGFFFFFFCFFFLVLFCFVFLAFSTFSLEVSFKSAIILKNIILMTIPILLIVLYLNNFFPAIPFQVTLHSLRLTHHKCKVIKQDYSVLFILILLQNVYRYGIICMELA